MIRRTNHTSARARASTDTGMTTEAVRSRGPRGTSPPPVTRRRPLDPPGFRTRSHVSTAPGPARPASPVPVATKEPRSGESHRPEEEKKTRVGCARKTGLSPGAVRSSGLCRARGHPNPKITPRRAAGSGRSARPIKPSCRPPHEPRHAASRRRGRGWRVGVGCGPGIAKRGPEDRPPRGTRREARLADRVLPALDAIGRTKPRELLARREPPHAMKGERERNGAPWRGAV